MQLTLHRRRLVTSQWDKYSSGTKDGAVVVTPASSTERSPGNRCVSCLTFQQVLTKRETEAGSERGAMTPSGRMWLQPEADQVPST